MRPKGAKELNLMLTAALTDKAFLKRAGISATGMRAMMKAAETREIAERLSEKPDISCAGILREAGPLLDQICSEPREGWLTFCHDSILQEMYPYGGDARKDKKNGREESEARQDKKNGREESEARQIRAALILCEILHVAFFYHAQRRPFDPRRDFALLDRAEAAACRTGEEYERMRRLVREKYIYEFLRISAEITPFDTLGHIAGVHYVAMHAGRQLAARGLPVDLAMVSAAAAAHDIGKFGCRGSEMARIPYLHYYYTDQLLQRAGMPRVAHIASNHSTWDLELENLSVEALLLIYADFRVKSIRREDGREETRFYTLQEAFDVILGKLDNVDEAKRARYDRVYAKLRDFEDYMKSIGVSADLEDAEGRILEWKDPALLTPEESVDRLKYLAVGHNIRIMHRLGTEEDLGSLLESARTEQLDGNILAYVNTLEEYFTYMTHMQKRMTIRFLQERLTDRGGDIRRQSAQLIGDIISGYDEKYRKELPQGVTLKAEDIDSHRLWRDHLEATLLEDLQRTERQKRWIGYSLKFTLNRLIDKAAPEEREGYIEEFLDMLDMDPLDDQTAFILLDTILEMPLDLCDRELTEKILGFCETSLGRRDVETRVAALRVVAYLAEYVAAGRREGNAAVPAERGMDTWSRGSGEWDADHELKDRIRRILEMPLPGTGVVCTDYLKARIRMAIGPRSEAGAARGAVPEENSSAALEGEQPAAQEIRACLAAFAKNASQVFRENLKVGTPWVVKSVNIEVMLRALEEGYGEAFYIATNLANLLKVSERITVRHSAGNALVQLFPRLSWDQRNEIVIELTKGLEIGEHQYSKYIPGYLGVLILQLHPEELDEILGELQHLLDTGNDKVAGVTLDTLGIMLEHAGEHADEGAGEHADERTGEYADEGADEHTREHPLGARVGLSRREERVMGMLLQGMAHYHEVISEESLRVIGSTIFGSEHMTMEQKAVIFGSIHKKLLTLIERSDDAVLRLFNNAAALNSIYRFISGYEAEHGRMRPRREKRVAFFPGTFDPFSLGHKGIVQAILERGFEVYLALDEFSWSKNTQARLYRRKIMTMSCAGMNDVYIFPDDQPVNIANPGDLRRLKEILGDDMYIVVGSDVITGASCYRKAPEPDSIHSLNHIIFSRESAEEGGPRSGARGKNQLTGSVVELTLPTHLEDISSTRIRDNIDRSRDISSLIDPVVQSYIYDNALYLREPMYKAILSARNLKFHIMRKNGIMSRVTILDGANGDEVLSECVVRPVDTAHLYEEFRDQNMTAWIRSKALGRVLVIRDIWGALPESGEDPVQLALTETLAEALKEDFTFAIYHPREEADTPPHIVEVLRRQGFTPIDAGGRRTDCFGVDMRNPVVLFQNMDTVLKDPFNKDPVVEKALRHAHIRLQKSLTKLYPDTLILSFSSAVMHHKLIRRITEENGVPARQETVRTLGPYMCVPFGKILNGMAVPNTVTKTLHLEKSFRPDLSEFRIREYPFYAGIEDQIRTIRSFRRPVILVDDILHKGYRMRSIDPVLKRNDVEVRKLIVGLLSGRGQDLMMVQGREVDSVYFVPNLRAWFVESSQYPFIGGDGVERHTGTIDDAYTAINLIMPYVVPSFLSRSARPENIYDFSMVCLENARDILQTVEQQYQKLYQRKLTLRRLSEAVNSPKLTDVGQCLDFDRRIAASAYVQDDIERLQRLRTVIVEGGHGEQERK